MDRTRHRQRKTGPSKGPGSTAFLLAQVGAHAAHLFAERLAGLDLEPPHAGILRVIGAAPGPSQQALATMLGILPSRLVSLLDELEVRELLQRRPDPDDRRARSLHLTEKGRQALEAIGRLAREHGDSLCAALSDTEREQLSSLLRRIADQQGLVPGVHPGFKRLS